MSEKLLHLQWDDFKENVNAAFGRLRDAKEFADVTLACEDGQQIEAHKVILAASSPFFKTMLQSNKHPHPLIYFRGLRSEDLQAILDFLYFGEANVHQENLASFLTIAEEIKLEGLSGQTFGDVLEDEDQSTKDIKTEESTTDNLRNTLKPNVNAAKIAPRAIAHQFSGDLQALDQKVRSMVEKGENMIVVGKQKNGLPMQKKTSICKVCGKEGQSTQIRDHVEANHLEGICIPCDKCDKTFGRRAILGLHKRKFHQ